MAQRKGEQPDDRLTSAQRKAVEQARTRTQGFRSERMLTVHPHEGMTLSFRGLAVEADGPGTVAPEVLATEPVWGVRERRFIVRTPDGQGRRQVDATTEWLCRGVTLLEALKAVALLANQRDGSGDD